MGQWSSTATGISAMGSDRPTSTMSQAIRQQAMQRAVSPVMPSSPVLQPQGRNPSKGANSYIYTSTRNSLDDQNRQGSGSSSERSSRQNSQTKERERRKVLGSCTHPSHGSVLFKPTNVPEVPSNFIRFPREMWMDCAISTDVESGGFDDAVGFNDIDLQYLDGLWHQISGHTKNIGINYYVSLMTVYPEVRNKFPLEDIAIGARIQSHALNSLEYLISLSEAMENVHSYNGKIDELAEIHSNINITTEELTIMNNVFLNVLIKEVPDMMFPYCAYALMVFLGTATLRLYNMVQRSRERQRRNNHDEDDSDESDVDVVIHRHRRQTKTEEYEEITEWQLQVMDIHERRMEERNLMDPTSRKSHSLFGKLTPCVRKQTESCTRARDACRNKEK